MPIKLIPVAQNSPHADRFATHPEWGPNYQRTLAFFERVGWESPWHGYYAELDGELVASCGFKGPPKDGAVEVAYVVSEHHRLKGIGREVCRLLVELAHATDPNMRIVAETLPEENGSPQILRKNGFVRSGTGHDPKVGEVWLWQFQPATPQ